MEDLKDFVASLDPSPDGGQDSPTSGESQPPAPPDAGQAQPQEQQPTQQAQQETAQKPVNLYELPEFRQYQAAQERRAAELQKKMSDYEAQLEQATTANMDDFQRAQWEKAKYQRIATEREQQLQEMQQQIQLAQLQQQRQADLVALSQEFGVGVDDIANARTYDEARYMAEARRLAKRLEQLEGAQRVQTNRPDLGGGRANMPSDRVQADLDKAFRNRDAFAYVSMLSEQEAGD